MRHAVSLMSGALAATLALAGCKKPEPTDPQVEHAWVRLSAVPGHPAAGYFELHAGDAPDKLVAVTSPTIASVQMHQTLAGGMAGAKVRETDAAMATMRPVAAVPMPPHSVVSFEPGGYHLMLMGLAPTLHPGSKAPFRLRLASGRTLDTQAQVVGAGDPAPSAGAGG